MQAQKIPAEAQSSNGDKPGFIALTFLSTQRRHDELWIEANAHGTGLRYFLEAGVNGAETSGHWNQRQNCDGQLNERPSATSANAV